MSLYTNSASRRDFFVNVFSENAQTPCQVLIAVAFLTDADQLLTLVRRGCRVKLIVRLGYPTSPAALRKLLNEPGIQVRYINNHTFHPKLYIFEERCAVVGSANLTQSALTSNQEVNVAIPAGDPRYPELVSLFLEYWSQVRVLEAHSEVLSAYERLFEKYRDARVELERFHNDVARLADTRIANIDRGAHKTDVEDVFLESYRATYQGFLDAFRTVQKVYIADGRRKHPENVIPLRLEIDSFLSWVRERYTTGESYRDEPLLHGAQLESKIQGAIEEWFKAHYSWFEDQIVPLRYPTITRILGSKSSISAASYDQIVEALSCENSFYDRLRFFKGGHETHTRVFMESNDSERVKRTLTYLLFGKGDPIVRMGRCIFDPAYRLNEFGRSAVQELLGWINEEDLPICNNRTLRSLRWFGFDVTLVQG